MSPRVKPKQPPALNENWEHVRNPSAAEFRSEAAKGEFPRAFSDDTAFWKYMLTPAVPSPLGGSVYGLDVEEHLLLERIVLVRDNGGTAVVQLGFNNRGRGDVRGVTLNVLVPDYADQIFRTDAAGQARPGNGLMQTTSESLDGFYGSIYWVEAGIDFPGRVAHPLYFGVVLRGGVRSFPILVRATSSDTPPLSQRATIDRDI